MSTSSTTRPAKKKGPTGRSGQAPSKGSDLTVGNDTANKAAVKPLSAPFDPQISVCADAVTTATTTRSLRDVLQEIRDGEHRRQVEFIRESLAKAEDEDAKTKAKALKTKLQAILFSGEFSIRNGGSLTQASGVLCVDIDEAGNEVALKDAQTRRLIEDDQHTLAAFTSPSGVGLKVLVRIPTTCPHINAFAAARDYFKTKFGLAIDEACKDVNRICFTSYDPVMFSRDNCPELPVPVSQAMQAVQPAGGAVVQMWGATSPSVLDDFNARADPLPLLRSHGWEVGPEQPDGSRRLRRPGKTDSGWSATWNHAGRRTLCVFSSNAAPFEVSPTTYAPAAIYAHLECNGDFKRAAAKLRSNGYGPTLRESVSREAGTMDLRSRLKACRFDAATQPPKPSPRFFLTNTGICTTGNLTTIAAQAKAGKSALIGAAIAAAICAENQTQGCDNLGLTATPPKGRRLLHFDTEQSPYDADRLVRRSLQRAGAQAGVAFLESYSVAGLTPPDLRSALKMLMTELSSVHGVFGVIIDGVADFVSDVNDAAECNAFIAELLQLAIDHDCPIICILHENPTQDSGKMRGHLGSQLERKAESNLRLKRTEDVTTVFGDKMRGAPILEKNGPAFRWSAIDDMHMSTVNAGQVAMVKKQAKYADLAEDVWQSINNPTTARRCDVIKAIMVARNIMNSTAEDRFDDLRDLRIIIKDLKTGFWSLNPI